MELHNGHDNRRNTDAVFINGGTVDPDLCIGRPTAFLLASVHREFVHHIAEDEVDGQEERQDDRKEDRQQGVRM